MSLIGRLTFLLLLVSTSAWAESCKQLNVAAIGNWRPYVHVNDKGVSGFSPQVLGDMMTSLDIPFKFISKYNEYSLIDMALKYEEVDLLLLAKKPNAWHEHSFFIKPAYSEDAMMLAVRAEDVGKINKWQDLMTLVGQTSEPFYFTDGGNYQPYYYTDGVQRTVDNYLYVEKVADINPALAALAEGDIDYVLDSRNRMSIATYKQDSLKVIKALPKSAQYEGLYLLMRKNGPCSHYWPYLSEQIKRWQESGRLHEIMLQHYPRLRDAVVTPEPVYQPIDLELFLPSLDHRGPYAAPYTLHGGEIYK